MRIAIVNDMLLAVEALRRVLMLGAHYEVVWVAKDGEEAVANCRKDKPDLILMDLNMPRMDGVEATRRIMRENPCPILIVTASIHEHSGMVFDALGVGAIDAVNTPALGLSGKGTGAEALLAKISTLSKLTRDPAMSKSEAKHPQIEKSKGSQVDLIAIGCSAGGPVALATILSMLPKDFSIPLVVIQHLDSDFAPSLADWLSKQSVLPIHLVKQGDLMLPGNVYLAGSSDHLVFSRAGVLGYTRHPIDNPYRPSVDVFFGSVVQMRSLRAVGVLLTGMGRDGAGGLKGLRGHGMHTIVQDQNTCAVFGMPKAAIELEAADEILPISKIASAIIRSSGWHPMAKRV